MDTMKINKKNTQMVAHAGLCGMETANTLAGTIAAGNRTYYGIEVDVRVTKDGDLVLVHNDNLLDAAGVDMPIKAHTAEELMAVPLFDRRFFMGMEKYNIQAGPARHRTDLRVARFEEYIRVCKKYGKVAVTELKDRMSPEEIAYALRVVAEHDYLPMVTFISFVWENLVELRRQCPEATVQFLTDERRVFTDEFLDEVAAAGFDLDIHCFTITHELVERIHARGIKVNCWTVDDPAWAERIIDMGVDYLTSNILE